MAETKRHWFAQGVEQSQCIRCRVGFLHSLQEHNEAIRESRKASIAEYGRYGTHDKVR